LISFQNIFICYFYTFYTIFDYLEAPNLPAKEKIANFKVEDATLENWPKKEKLNLLKT
jgi:hypothetical protein